MALAIGGLGVERAMVVRGRDGLDEISTMDATDVLLIEEDRIDALELTPAVLGVKEGMRPQAGENNTFLPLEAQGIQAMSMAFMVVVPVSPSISFLSLSNE